MLYTNNSIVSEKNRNIVGKKNLLYNFQQKLNLQMKIHFFCNNIEFIVVVLSYG
jgi:hypothetical protein